MQKLANAQVLCENSGQYFARQRLRNKRIRNRFNRLVYAS